MWKLKENPRDYGAKPVISTENVTAHFMNSSENTEDSAARPHSATSSLQGRVKILTPGLVSLSENPTSSTGKDGRQRESSDDWSSTALRYLGKSQPISERKAGAELVGVKITYISSDMLGQIWEVASDLFEKSASLDFREAGFSLLSSSLLHSDLGFNERMKLFMLVSVPIEASQVEEQIRLLGILTSKGQNLQPFARPLVGYMCNILGVQYKAALEARKKLARTRTTERKRPPLPEERGLYALLGLITDIILADSAVIYGQELDVVIQQTALIARMAPSVSEMKEALSVIKAITSDLERPTPHLESCVEVLSAIAGTDYSLNDMAWQGLIDKLRSTQQAQVIELLISTMLSTPQGKETSRINGAVTMVLHLIRNDGANNLPKVSFPNLHAAMAATEVTNPRQARNVLRVIRKLFEIPQFGRRLVHDGHWGSLFHVIYRVIGDDESEVERGLSVTSEERNISGSSNTPSEATSGASDEVISDTIQELKKIAEAIASIWPQISNAQKTTAIELFYRLRDKLPPEAEEPLMSYMINEHLVHPGTPGWAKSVSRLIDNCLVDVRRKRESRILALETLDQIVGMLQLEEDVKDFRALVFGLLQKFDVQVEDDVDVIGGLSRFVARYSNTARTDDVDLLLDFLWPMITAADTLEPVPDDLAIDTKGNTVVISMVMLFLLSSCCSPERTSIAFEKLMAVARARDLPSSARLTAMRLLARLRCNVDHEICWVLLPDSLGLASSIARMADGSTQLGIQGDPMPTGDDSISGRTGRSSTIVHRLTGTSRASTQSASRPESELRFAPRLWMYPGPPGLPEVPKRTPSELVHQHTKGSDIRKTLRLSHWLEEMINILQQVEDDWEIYSYVLVHLPSQLSNPTLFSNSVPHIQLLRSVIASQLLSGTFREPPSYSGVKKGDVAFCLFHTLILLLGYSKHFTQTEQDNLVKTLLVGITSWDRVTKLCIQGLTLCCHVLPHSIAKSLSAILQKMSQIITQSHLAVDILEFLAGLARLPNVYVNLTENELRTVFAICIRQLQYLRDQRQKRTGNPDPTSSHIANRMSGLSGDSATASASSRIVDVHNDLPQYVFALAYHVLTIWFLSLRLVDRAKHVGWITSNLASKSSQGQDVLDEQSQVTLDMMHRTAYLDLGETLPRTDFSPSDGRIFKKAWLLGLSIVTVETAAGTGLTHLVKRQASGTTYAIYQQHTAPLPPHHVAAPTDVMSSIHGPESRLNIFPNHVFLQLTSTIAPTPSPMEAICLPDDEATRRAISAFDRNDTVDGYKVGVIYIGHNQSAEAHILANTRGSNAFNTFLGGLGTKVQLKGAQFNTQGLDKEYDTDGTHTYAWRDRITEIVFHVPTLMPTDLSHDPQCINKKRHVGNDYVNIFFNDSGLPFEFDTIPSQFNYVNIVITPETLTVPAVWATRPPRRDDSEGTTSTDGKELHFTIQTFSHPTFPQISPTASYRLLHLMHLPDLVRQIALNASVFSNVWAHREGGEHVSSWRNRLREIKKLRARFVGTGTSASERYPGAKGNRVYLEGDRFVGAVVMGGLAEEDGIVSGLDFSRWAGPNPPLN